MKAQYRYSSRVTLFGLATTLMMGGSAAQGQEAAATTAPPVAIPITGVYKAPQWSPDGAWLAFTTPRYQGVYLARPDGGGFRRLTDEPRAGYRFAWSPDGKKIAFKSVESADDKVKHSVKTVSLDDGRIDTLLRRDGGVGIPQWLRADAMHIVLDGRLATVELNGKIRSTATHRMEAHCPAIHPTRPEQGEKSDELGPVVYCDDQDHDRVILLESNGRRSYLTDAGAGRYYDPSWSPRGDRLLVHDLGGHLYLIDPVTKARTDLGEGCAGRWSPDGRRVICNTSLDDGHNVTAADIVLIHVGDGERTPITQTPERLEMYPCWSPDGRQIAYGDAKTGGLFIQTLGAGERR